MMLAKMDEINKSDCDKIRILDSFHGCAMFFLNIFWFVSRYVVGAALRHVGGLGGAVPMQGRRENRDLFQQLRR
jgi:hypothetical protein